MPDRLGPVISRRRVAPLSTAACAGFVDEARAVLQAKLATARWLTVDDTRLSSARARAPRRPGCPPQGDAHTVKLATAAARRDGIRAHGWRDAVVILSNASRFRVGRLASCWSYAERLVHKLIAAQP